MFESWWDVLALMLFGLGVIALVAILYLIIAAALAVWS
jgi:hypothetical protein